MPSIGKATLTMDWRGRARERAVKLHLVGATSNPYQGLAWSNARTRGKVASFSNFSARRATFTRDWRGRATEREVKLQHFGMTRNPYQGLAWSNA